MRDFGASTLSKSKVAGSEWKANAALGEASSPMTWIRE